MAIIIAHRHILLIKRNRPGFGRYYVYPGGGVEPGESPRVSAIRELREETGLLGRVVRRVVTSQTLTGGQQDYFLVRAPFLPVAVPQTSPERTADYRQRRGLTKPVWVPVGAVTWLRIFPPEMRSVMQHFLTKGFPRTVINLGTVGFREKVVRH